MNNAAGLVINGIVGGTIGLIKAGTGHLTLTAVETYTGSTLITAGTLQIGNGLTGSIAAVSPVAINEGTLAINLVNGGLFAHNVVDNNLLTTIATGSNTLSGVISGTGGFTQNGTGVTILTGANTYTAATTVLQGTLQIGNGGTSGSFLGNVTDNAALVFDRLDNVTFAGTIAGTGSVAQSGSGKLILSANNIYSGGTIFNTGILSVSSDGNLGSGELIFNGGTLEAATSITSNKNALLNTGGGAFLADTDTSSTLNGVIRGAGSLTENGPGALTLTGMNTYSGGTILGTILNAGLLNIGSSRALGTGNMVMWGAITSRTLEELCSWQTSETHTTCDMATAPLFFPLVNSSCPPRDIPLELPHDRPTSCAASDGSRIQKPARDRTALPVDRRRPLHGSGPKPFSPGHFTQSSGGA